MAITVSVPQLDDCDDELDLVDELLDRVDELTDLVIEERRRDVANVEWLTRTEAADYLSTTEDGVRGLERHGHLKLGVHYFRPTPRLLRYRRSALERFMTSPTLPEPEQETVTEDELREQLRERAKQLAGGRR